MTSQPKTLGELRSSSNWSEQRLANRSLRQELRENLLCRMEKGETLFPGVHGYDDTVIPQIINAILSRHHFILLGLRGQAKSRILRGLVGFMDAQVPVVAGCEINDNPYQSDLPGLPGTNCGPRAIRRRLRGFRAIIATWKSWPRRT